jgi:hypothetical protein
MRSVGFNEGQKFHRMPPLEDAQFRAITQIVFEHALILTAHGPNLNPHNDRC